MKSSQPALFLEACFTGTFGKGRTVCKSPQRQRATFRLLRPAPRSYPAGTRCWRRYFMRNGATGSCCLMHETCLPCKTKWRKYILLRSYCSPDPSILNVYLWRSWDLEDSLCRVRPCGVKLPFKSRTGGRGTEFLGCQQCLRYLFRGFQLGAILPPRGHLAILLSQLGLLSSGG